VELQEETNAERKQTLKNYVDKLETITTILGKTELIKKSKKYLPGYRAGDRSAYRVFFEPLIKPNFMYTRLMSHPPSRAREIDLYKPQEDVEVTIYDNPETVKRVYHLMPPEFKLHDDEYSLLIKAREILSKHKPRKEEFVDPERMRDVFFNVSRDLIEQIAEARGIEIKYDKINKLAEILVRLTVGFGLVEVILYDKDIENIYINPPIGKTPMIVTHNKYGEMETNIIPNLRDVKSWTARFRMLSGRPLDEAHPVLDTELVISHARARVALVQQPLSPAGFGFAFRQHRPKPWTLPLFMKYKMVNAMGAGLLWFLVDGARTMLVAGTRGSGKSSLLGSLMVQIMRRNRVITVEDTLELPVTYLQKLGYDILPIKVRSAILGEKNELSAADGIRTTLRLGDSALIVGEVRSEEAKALYEAMRVGALANVVAGTIHGDSPYGIFDRVVNDLGVPKTSFKATDLIVLANKIRSPDGLKEYRRLISITEVRKHWEEDPVAEHGFVRLMDYDAKKDDLVATGEMIEGESEVLKSIAGRVKEWAGNWDRVIDNIHLRAKISQMLVDYAKKVKDDKILESDFIVQSNDAYHRISERIADEIGYATPSRVLKDYEAWLKAKLRKSRI
jgi:type IV secretory pathway ATPase VirB11/archaellum biosynthesis ATPase